VALAAAGVLAATAADARPWHYWHGGYNAGPAFALGAFAGAVTGAAVANSYYYHPYGYYYPPPRAYYPAPAYGYGYAAPTYGYGYNPYYGPEPTYGLVVR
jgi:hypothetical protein